MYAAAQARAYICDGAGSVDAIAAETASAFALAVASASVDCRLEGDASVHVDAKASAYAQAEIWAAAYFNAYAFGTNCETCDAFAESYGYIEKYVFLQAVADAEVKVCCMHTVAELCMLCYHHHVLVT